MSDAHENPRPEGHVSDVVVLILSVVVLLATVPTVFLLVWLKIVNSQYLRRDVYHKEANLPAAESSSPNKKLQDNPLCRRVRVVVRKLRGVAVAAGGAVALRSREALKEVRGRVSKLFGDRGRRYSDLPIMRQKSWQMLAESHTELTLTTSNDDDKAEQKVEEVEHKTVENPKKSIKTVRFAIGDEVEKETSVQKPQPAVIAADKT
ncbi:hypothetical protein DHEL01_v209131 [Diaporthe helianthi]|uniref:Transmembrane protein n=1 Tax=Diaporthe helianthi TaxID=158607 RepID=A0A2P5HQE3_DIAHE|nr:hypothetical protein DHEL01_v209131 [Diaporthe helianthi]